MDESKATSKAVVVSALLHLGIVAFLAGATVPCSFYESLFETLHLPASWNPISCAKPLQLEGPVIEATLIGPTGSPPPKHAKVKPVPDSTPPPPAVPPPPTPEVPKIAPLPPPPEHPDVKDQEKVVADALQKAEDAKHEQEEKQRQRQAELDAQAAKQKEQKKLDDLFAKMDAASQQTKKLDNKAKQAKQQMEDLKDAKDDGQPDLPKADQRQTGNNSDHTDLSDAYAAAIQNAVTPNWLRPVNMPDVPCVVHIVQLPGGEVMSAKVDASCPYDEAGKRSIENAVLRSQPLPYKGFESVFKRELNFTFRPQ
jgi:colicin import membrane protein